jgi:aminoglycoside phosphotransferase (APT) family kinase protein
VRFIHPRAQQSHRQPMTAQEQFVDNVGTPGLDRSSVEPWLANNLPGYTSPAVFRLIAAGGSNLTYLVTDSAGTRFVLRRPPVGDRLATAHDVVREGRIISGLESTGIPVPRCLAVCDDRGVCDAPFVVLSYEEGWILRDEETARLLGEDGCRRAGIALFETLAALHLLDPADAGLGGLSKPDGYVERQLLRWSRQVEQITIEPHPLFRELQGRLLAAVPSGRDTGHSHLVHGDFHIDNAIFDGCFAVRALLDWELSTLGDPIADLAWALMFWSESPDEPVRPSKVITTAPGFPTRAEVTERYQSVSGFDISALSYYEAFCFWKMG